MNTISLYEQENTLLNSLMAVKQNTGTSSNTKNGTQATASESDEVTFDDLLVSVGATRNRDSFIRLFEYFAPRVKSFLMQGGFNPESADELAQETMLTVWDKAASFDPSQAKASTWIFTIARNKKIDHIRKYKRVPLKAEDLAFAHTEYEAPDDTLETMQDNKALSEAMEKLPEEQAALLRKSFFEDKTQNDIAEESNIPLGTVKSRIRLALERLRYHLGTGTGTNE